MLGTTVGARTPHARVLPVSTTPGLLMHFDGSLAEVLRGRTMAGSTDTLSTVAPTFGSGALVIPNEGGTISTTAYLEDFRFSGAFTVAVWVRWQRPDTGTYGPFGDVVRLVDASDEAVWKLTVAGGEGRNLQWRNYDGRLFNYNWDGAPGGIGEPGTAVLVAVTRDASNNTRLFVGGVLVGTVTDAYDYSAVVPASLQIGTWHDSPENQYLWLDDLFVLPGTALWTASFTPPVTPFSA